jgi:hypothetical protein
MVDRAARLRLMTAIFDLPHTTVHYKRASEYRSPARAEAR